MDDRNDIHNMRQFLLHTPATSHLIYLFYGILEFISNTNS